jgi:hypothetical protein
MKIETTEERLHAMGRAGPNPDGSISLGDAFAVGFLRTCECGRYIPAWTRDTIWLDGKPFCPDCAVRKGIISQLTAEIDAHTAKLGSLNNLLQLCLERRQSDGRIGKPYGNADDNAGAARRNPASRAH